MHLGVRYCLMNRAGSATFLLLLVFVVALDAQEVKFIDLTAAPQRLALRVPAPDPSPSGKNLGSGGGGGSGSDCSPDIRDPHAVGVYLDDLDGAKIDPVQPFNVEFRFVNTGKLPITIPVSPDLSDLQPADPSMPFNYLSLGLVLRVRNVVGSAGYVQLYGAGDHAGTTRVLMPG